MELPETNTVKISCQFGLLSLRTDDCEYYVRPKDIKVIENNFFKKVVELTLVNKVVKFSYSIIPDVDFFIKTLLSFINH